LASKLCSRIDFLYPQTFCVFCIDRVAGSEILLKLIVGLRNHSYNSSIYLIHIPLHSNYINMVSATSFRKFTSTACVCGCNVAAVYEGGCRTHQLRTSSTTTSFGRVGQVLDKLHTLLCTLGLRSAHYEFMEPAAAAVQVNGLGD